LGTPTANDSLKTSVPARGVKSSEKSRLSALFIYPIQMQLARGFFEKIQGKMSCNNQGAIM
jgi:hypothetical protein